MLAYKLFRRRKDSTLGSLFINRKRVLIEGVWMDALPFRTKGYAYRPGWHVMSRPEAPHLTLRDRVWRQVEIDDWQIMDRPASQGGRWFIAGRMKILPNSGIIY